VAILAQIATGRPAERRLARMLSEWLGDCRRKEADLPPNVSGQALAKTS